MRKKVKITISLLVSFGLLIFFIYLNNIRKSVQEDWINSKENRKILNNKDGITINDSVIIIDKNLIGADSPAGQDIQNH